MARSDGSERYRADSGILLTDGTRRRLDATYRCDLLVVVRARLPVGAWVPGSFEVPDLGPTARSATTTGALAAATRPSPGWHDARPLYGARLFTRTFGRYWWRCWRGGVWRAVGSSPPDHA